MCLKDFLGQWYIYFLFLRKKLLKKLPKEISIIRWIGKSVKPSKKQFTFLFAACPDDIFDCLNTRIVFMEHFILYDKI